MYCISYCLGKAFDLNRLEKYLDDNQLCDIVKHKNVLEVLTKEKGLIFFFKNGTMITWHLKRYQCSFWLKRTLPFTEAPLSEAQIVKDEFSYKIDKESSIRPHHYFDIDCITLENNDTNIKLSFSFGLSQSIKLNHYEARLENLISSALPMIEQIKTSRFKKLKKHKLSQAISDLFIEKSDLNLVSNFLYKPSFFWHHPNLEHYYNLIEEYLDIDKRITTLNQRLNVLNEILHLMLSYNESQQTTRLELIIIALIAIEVLFNVLNFHF